MREVPLELRAALGREFKRSLKTRDPLQAKFLSTGLFGLPADSILAFVKKRGLECLVVDSAGAVKISDGWRSRITLIEGQAP